MLGHTMKLLVLSSLVVLLAGAYAGPVNQQQGKAPTHSLKGKLLVASSRIKGNAFERSVVLMITHDAEGAFGLIVNKPLGTAPKKRIYAEAGITGEDPEGVLTVFYGGPVAPITGFVIHDGGMKGEATQPVVAGVSISDQKFILEALARGEGPKRYVFVVGYAGWAPGQLETELRRNDWVTAPLDRSIVYDQKHGTKWKRATESRYRNL